MKVRFWHDMWCVDDYLEKSFPQFISIAEDKNTSIASYLRIPGEGDNYWNLNFIRAFP